MRGQQRTMTDSAFVLPELPPRMNHRKEKPGAPARPTRERVVSMLQFVLLLALFVTFFGGLLAAVFELFRFVDFLLLQEWEWGWTLVGQTGLMLVIGVVVIRVAWWLSLAILGLVTRKYDPVSFLDSTIPLDRSEYGALYDRVDEICRQVGAAHPDDIRLNPWPQCYVIEQRRFSLATNRSLTLVIGLPQLLVFTMAELRVVLAHEMAHFGNRDTTLIVFLFRFVESLRLALTHMRGRWWHWIDPLHWFFVAFHAALQYVASPIQRQLELRADRISAELCGGDLAAHTLLKDWFLDGQFDEAVEVWMSQETASPRDASAPAREDALATGTNVFQVFADRWRELSPAAEQYLVDRLAQEQILLDTDPHPSTHERLTFMRQFPPVDVHDGKPASSLLPQLKQLEIEAATILETSSR